MTCSSPRSKLTLFHVPFSWFEACWQLDLLCNKGDLSFSCWPFTTSLPYWNCIHSLTQSGASQTMGENGKGWRSCCHFLAPLGRWELQVLGLLNPKELLKRWTGLPNSFPWPTARGQWDQDILQHHRWYLLWETFLHLTEGDAQIPAGFFSQQNISKLFPGGLLSTSTCGRPSEWQREP